MNWPRPKRLLKASLKILLTRLRSTALGAIFLLITTLILRLSFSSIIRVKSVLLNLAGFFLDTKLLSFFCPASGQDPAAARGSRANTEAVGSSSFSFFRLIGPFGHMVRLQETSANIKW